MPHFKISSANSGTVYRDALSFEELLRAFSIPESDKLAIYTAEEGCVFYYDLKAFVDKYPMKIEKIAD